MMKQKRLRVALLGCWHVHAADYVRQARAIDAVDLVSAWDADDGRLNDFAPRFGLRAVPKLDEILGDPAIDGVIVTTSTAEHRQVITSAAINRKHVFTEKVIAATYRDARDIVAACDASGVTLTVSLPRLYENYALTIQRLLGGRELGELTNGRIRLSHEGLLPSADHPEGWLPKHFMSASEAQGGSLIDFGVHPLYLLHLFLGEAESVQAMYGHHTGAAVEDFGVVTIKYKNGAIGVVETGLVNPDRYFGIELHGTKALLGFGTPFNNKLTLSAGEHGDRGAWREVAMDAAMPVPLQQWVGTILNSDEKTLKTNRENNDYALALSALVEAANTSAASGQRISLSSITGA
jgi:1,5-anhydro-D-fructose reductase (1,5-anhydro-D-mannitol-forming)